MVEVWIPYGEVEVPVRLSDENLAWLADPGTAGGERGIEAAKLALQSPEGAKSLREIVKPNSKVAVALNGPPSRTDASALLRLVLEEASSAGAAPGEVEVIVAAGTQLEGGGELASLEPLLKGGRLAVSDPREGEFAEVGVTSFGTKVQLNKSFVDADARIAVGELRANWFYGLNGPWSAVLGICSQATIEQNGKLALKKDAKRQRGLQNNVHLDSREAESMANVDLSLAVAAGRGGAVLDAFAGSPEKVHERSVDVARKLYAFEAASKVDILLVGSGGLPFDSTLSSACEAAFNFEEAVEKGGRIVLVAECRDGPGSGAFLDMFYRFKEAGAALGEVRKNFSFEGYKAAKLLELRERHGVSIVSSMPAYFAEKVFAFRTADTANEGLQNAFRFLGRGSRIGVAVDGSSSVVVAAEVA
ncbi:MAG: DUF2088 domain-containing protein [Candidatus Brockarchaeota archaeon]|nr:DUF2088 domain-containing protein [Candidatus Brockarchaeota archaeon]